MLAVPAVRVDVDLVLLRLALQVVLGQRRTVVGLFGLVSQQDDPAAETLRAQRLA